MATIFGVNDYSFHYHKWGAQRDLEDWVMVTWQDEFIRLSELHRHEVEKWLEGAGNANLVIEAGESEKAFLLRWLSTGQPPLNEQMPD